MGDSQQHQLKRNRIPLSCFPCRASKQKCDRARPCGQCTRKSHPENCRYAPRPEKRGRQAKGMAARLERLEGMVRTMIEAQADGKSGEDESPEADADVRRSDESTVVHEAASGGMASGGRGSYERVVKGERATSYVGATHFMAILEDIEDLKSFFDDPEEPDGDSPPSFGDLENTSEMLLFSAGTYRSKEDLLNLLPERQVADRLISRYFGLYSTSQHLIHKPSFLTSYNQFWEDPSKTPLNWIALLFMILALGVYFSTFTAPEELLADSDMEPLERVKLYRSAAGWALVYGKYLQPGPLTLQPFILFVESEFLLNRANQTNCYMLMAVAIRMMLKMGLHRDPSKLASIGPFEGEMRRRVWSLATTLDLLVSFHVGLPSMIQGIPSDTQTPRNILDEDFDETSTELPPPRPLSEYTFLSYPIAKYTMSKVFGKVAAHLHSLTPPSSSDVLHLDQMISDTWNEVPSSMKLRPLNECVTETPQQTIQRFGLACLYEKSRCVLHRRYLTEAIPKKEHDYSRRVCIESALSLMSYQRSLFEATKPGHILRSSSWFVSSLAVHDFLLAGMVIYMVIQSPHYSEVGGTGGWPAKEELLQLLKQSHSIWSALSRDAREAKTADVIGTMLRKLGVEVPNVPDVPAQPVLPTTSAPLQQDVNMLPIAGLSTSDQGEQSMGGGERNSAVDMTSSLAGLNSSWVAVDNEVDWRAFDTMVLQVQSQENAPDVNQAMTSWFERSPDAVNDMDFMSGAWEDITQL